MSDRPIEDQLRDRIDNALFDLLIDRIQSRPTDYAVNGAKPELLFTRDPEIYPLVVDLGDDRFTIEVDVTVRKIDKGSEQDPSCTEEEAYDTPAGGVG